MTPSSPISWGCITTAGNAFRPLLDKLVITEILSYSRVGLYLSEESSDVLFPRPGSERLSRRSLKARRQGSVGATIPAATACCSPFTCPSVCT